MWRESLFALAHVCHLSPVEVGELAFPDFVVLAGTAEKWLEMEVKHPRM